jgi:hypothetical protein
VGKESQSFVGGICPFTLYEEGYPSRNYGRRTCPNRTRSNISRRQSTSNIHRLSPGYRPPPTQILTVCRRRISSLLRLVRHLHLPLQIRNIRPSRPRSPSLGPPRRSLPSRRCLRHHPRRYNRLARPRLPPPNGREHKL